MFSTKNLKRYGCLLAIVLAGVLLAGHIDISAGIAEYGLTRTDGYITTGTCSRSGVYTLKFVRNPSSHSTYTTHWSPGLPDLTFGYHIVLDGYGFVQASMTYSVNGLSGTKNWGPERVGNWGHRGAFSLWVPYSTRVTAVAYAPSISEFDFDVPDAYGQYNWSSSGTVNLQAMYCKRTAAFWGQWEPFGAPIPETWNSQGSWELKMTYVCPVCSQDVTHFSQHHITCNACGGTYWKCGAGQVLARYSKTAVSDGHGRHFQANCQNCRANFWVCKNDANPIHTGITCSTCGETYYKCPTAARHVCSTTTTTGNTNSNTVSNNGGTVSNGRNSGDSSNRVRCQNTNPGATRRTRTHCDKGEYASSRYAHRTTCWKGHEYWSCDPIARRYHTSSPSHRR